ncbi:NlpC/P60 family protein [Glycomyces sp. TRM65418]|uniref:C40 family peptidase n=1 Tax=Glycomyces sp. TRM65418 TaxID=2867006 RepID=UPI001CE6F709|nr:C40 family peptidase [Glycomyces sp. TRM65418]MCC3764557.1 NlpC/P60 family protein [Glycomyces sp. TRM65418]QZD54224.1 C40 family peptidase [Glycomyces sp. TRM65418]
MVVATPTQAGEIDLAQADSSEIRVHVDDLERERTSVEDDMDRLEAERLELSALIEQADLEFGTVEAQLTRATEAIDTASDDLSSKIEALALLRTEQSVRYEAAQRAGERLEVIGPMISRLVDRSEGLGADIETARRALEEAEEREREEAAARARATAAASGPSPESGSTVVQFAYDQLGKPYGAGMAGPNAYDCSGLVAAAYSQSGTALPRSSQAQWNQTEPIGRGDLAPGDLVFSHGLGHVAIYIGRDQVVHATKPGDTVKIAPLGVLPVDGYRRVPG